MHKQKILLDGLLSLHKTENVEIASEYPLPKGKYIQVWRINTEISIQDKCKELELFFCFKESVPYTLPDVYAFEYKFGDFPHIGNDHKLCLFEEGVTYNLDDYTQLIAHTLKKAKKLISDGVNQINESDFEAEISSYWCHSYEKDYDSGSSPILLYDEPTSTSIMYAQQVGECQHPIVIYSSNPELPFGTKNKHGRVYCPEALFVKDFPIWMKPPFSITGLSLNNLIESHRDFKEIKNYINKHSCGLLLFKFPNTAFLCGLEFGSIKTNRDGFRNGSLTRYDIISKFELKNKFVKRVSAKLYNLTRLAERTLGCTPLFRRFYVGGLGSVGSNLVQFLSSYMNYEFTLVDYDLFSVDNVGRHLLGLSSIGMFKAKAIENYLKSLRPEITNKCIIAEITEKESLENIDNHTAIFLCTGSFMDEKLFLHRLDEMGVNVPVFILWLEPYGAAGHMIYLKGGNYESSHQSLFDSKTSLYNHNVINNTDYLNRSTLFTKNDSGCNGTYTNYGSNDVIMFLSEMMPNINRLLLTPANSTTFRWIGNTSILDDKGIGFTI